MAWKRYIFPSHLLICLPCLFVPELFALTGFFFPIWLGPPFCSPFESSSSYSSCSCTVIQLSTTAFAGLAVRSSLFFYSWSRQRRKTAKEPQNDGACSTIFKIDFELTFVFLYSLYDDISLTKKTVSIWICKYDSFSPWRRMVYFGLNADPGFVLFWNSDWVHDKYEDDRECAFCWSDWISCVVFNSSSSTPGPWSETSARWPLPGVAWTVWHIFWTIFSNWTLLNLWKWVCLIEDSHREPSLRHYRERSRGELPFWTGYVFCLYHV